MKYPAAPFACPFAALLLVFSSPLCRATEFKNEASNKELPEGASLASHFVGDAGIGTSESVIFADGFETGELGSGWGETRNPGGKVLGYADPDKAELGRRCLRVESHLAEDTGGGLTCWFESADTLFIRFYTKFDPACDYLHHFVTLRANRGLHGKDKWSGFGQAGLKPEGTERFSTAIEPWGNNGSWPPPGRWNFYSYWPDMSIGPDGHYWGNSFCPDDSPPIRRGEWICVEFMLKHNTPGQSDGAQAFWIDGRLLGYWKGFKWRTSADLKANALTLETYVTDRWTSVPVNVALFDNVVVARSYIGPVGGAATR